MIRIVTRKSQLALWQAEHVQSMLEEAGHETTLIPIETKGDKVLNVQLSKIGSKGVFTEELEQMLASGEADIAVHSAKDLQSSLPAGFNVLAFTEREQVNDVLVSNKAVTLDENITIGTSSTRRVAFLKHHYPYIKITDMRGNLQTRIRKMKEGQCDALLLAYAGVHRMGYHDMIKHVFDASIFTPAVGQGSLAIEQHETLDPSKAKAIAQVLNHEKTSQCLKTERSFLATMNGGCSIPVFGLANLLEDGQIHLRAGIIDLDGKELIHEMETGTDAVELGESLANKILSLGGDRILKEIRKSLDQS